MIVETNKPEIGPMFFKKNIPCPENLKPFVNGDVISIELAAQTMVPGAMPQIDRVAKVSIGFKDNGYRDIKIVSNISGPAYEMKEVKPYVLVSNIGGELAEGQMELPVLGGVQIYTSEQAIESMPVLYGAVSDWVVSGVDTLVQSDPKNAEYYSRLAKVWENVKK